MKRLVIYFGNQYLNIEADRIEDDGKFVKAYDEDNRIVAMIDVAIVDAAYLTQKAVTEWRNK